MNEELEDPFGENAPYTRVPFIPATPEPVEQPSLNVIYDDETMVTVDEETGEVLGVVGAPSDTANIKDIAEWLGEKLTWIEGRLAGLTAEKQTWLDKISKQYDPRIKHFQRFKDYLINLYKPIFDTYARTAIFNEDGSLRTRSKSVKIGLLKFGFTTTRPRTDVLHQDEAVDLIRREIAWLQQNGDKERAQQLKDAIKVTRSLLKSNIPLNHLIGVDDPEDQKLFWSEAEIKQFGDQTPEIPLQTYLEKKGIIHWYEGGEQEFHLG